MSGRYIYFQDPVCLSQLNKSHEDAIAFNESWINSSMFTCLRRGYEDDPTVAMWRFISEIWISLPLVIFGIVGNLVSLYVLSKHRQRQKLRTILILLRSLAVVDTLVLVSILFVRSLRYIGPRDYVVYFTLMYPYVYPTAYILRLMNTWMTVLLTIDRYVAVCKPLHAQRLCTVRRTYLQVALVVALSILLCVPRFFEYRIRYYNDGRYGFETTPLMTNQMYTVIYRIIFFLAINYFLPTVILVWLNTLVVIALRRSDAYRAESFYRLQRYSLSATSGTGTAPAGQPIVATVNPSAFKSTRSVTIVVVVIVCLCIVCHLVAMTAQVLYSLQVTFSKDSVIQSPTFELVRRHLSNLSNVLVTFNSAINFVVYCMCSRTFRAVLVSQFFCCLRRSQWFRACCPTGARDAMLLRASCGQQPPPVGHQSSTNTNSTRSVSNSVMMTMFSTRINNHNRKKDSLGDDAPPSPPDILAICGPMRSV